MSLPATTQELHSLPALIDRAAHTLAGARTAAEVLEARDTASLAYDAAKRAARLSVAKGAFDELIAKVYRAQADALTIEAEANRRLADEYDAAQERGELARAGNPNFSKAEKLASGPSVIPPKELHEARLVRDAEKSDPGVVARTVNEAVAAGEEPTKARVRRAVLRTVRNDPPPARPSRGKAAICAHVRDAIVALSGLPPPAEVAGFLRGADDAVIIDERLPAVQSWLEEFASIWSNSNAD